MNQSVPRTLAVTFNLYFQNKVMQPGKHNGATLYYGEY